MLQMVLIDKTYSCDPVDGLDRQAPSMRSQRNQFRAQLITCVMEHHHQ